MSPRGEGIVVVGDALLDRDVEGDAGRLSPDAPVPVLDEHTSRARPGGAALTASLAAPATASPGSAPIGAGEPPRSTRSSDRPPARNLTFSGVAPALTAAATRRRPTVWDPHPRGSDPIPGATLVTPNLAELRAAFHLAAPPPGPATRRAHESVRAVADTTAVARQAWNAQAVATTLGERGVLFVAGDGPPLAVPAEAVHGGDPCGAGDGFIAAVATRLLRGGLLSEAVTASRVRSGGGTVVVAGGCFDLLQAGHVSLLESARRLGDCLIVAVNSDSSVRRLKGNGRPLVTQSDRAALLAALACIDGVVVFDDDSPAELLKRIQPDVFVKGADYSAESLPEAAVLAGWGGQAVTVPYLSGRSTTGLLQLASGTR